MTFQTLALYATILTEIKSVFNHYVSDDDDDDDDDENNNINNNNLHAYKSLQRENRLVFSTELLLLLCETRMQNGEI